MTITFSYEINCIFKVADYNINMKETILRTYNLKQYLVAR